MVINGIIDLDNGEILEATGKHRISALDIQGSETAELKLTFYKNGSAVTDNSVVSGAVIDFGVKADADYTGTSYLIYHDTFSASTDGLEYSGTPTWATAEVETALGNESSVKLHGQVKVVISGVTYYSQVFEVEIHNNVIQAAGTTNSVIYPRLIQSTSDPTVNDDSLDGYGVSSLWLNTSSNAVHVLMDNTAGAAVWAGFLGLTNGQLANNLVFNDDLKAVFGTSSDGLEIYHSSNNSYIDDSGTGNLHIRSNGSGVFLQKSNGDNLAKFNTDGAAELYFSGSKKIESTDLGCTVTGKLIVSGDLDVDGTTTTFNSTVVTVDDPVFGIGGDTAPGSQDNKDRGVSFRYHDGASAKVGFYWWDNSENAFTFLTDTNDDSTEVFSGTLADLNVANIQLENLGKIKTWSNNNNYLTFNEWKTQSSTQTIENITGDIKLKASDSDGTIQFETNGTEAARFDSDGNFTTVENIKIPDGKYLFLGGSTDLQIYHNGFHSAIDNYTSDLYIRNRVNGGKDIIFLTKNSSDVLTELLRLDGSASSINVPDDVNLIFGGGSDLKLYHSSSLTESFVQNVTGNLNINNTSNGDDLILRQSNSSGTLENYIQLDGGGRLTRSYRNFRVQDDVKLQAGSSGDLEIKHTSNNSYIDNQLGNLYITNHHDNGQINFRSDNGSGGVKSYFYLDGNASSPGVYYTQFPDDSRLTFGDSKDFQIYHSSNATTLRNSGTGHVYLRNDSDGHDFIFQASKDNGDLEELLRLEGSNSRIGVSTSSPRTKFHIVGDDSDDDPIAATAAGAFLVSNSAGSYGIEMGVSSSGDGWIQSHSVASNNQYPLLLNPLGGNVGINTNSPDSLFECRTSNTSAETVAGFGNSNINAGLQILTSDGNLAWGFNAKNSRSLVFQTNQTERMRINASGNVGIGTTPTKTLHVNSGSTNEIAIFESSDGTGYISIQDSNTSYSLQGIGSVGDNLTLYANQAERMRINSSGNVGIGTTSFSNLLSVVGKSDDQTSVVKITRSHSSASNDTYTLDVDSSSHTSNMTAAGAFSVKVNSGKAFKINGNGDIFQNYINYTDESNYEALKISAESDHIRFRSESVGSFSSNTRDIRFNISTSERFIISNSGVFNTGNYYITGTGAVRNVGSHLNLSTSTQTNNDIIFKPNNTEAVRIGSDGVIDFSFANSTVKLFESANNDVRFGTNTSDAFSLIQNGSRRLLIAATGKVGIASTDPSPNADLTLGGGELCMAETTTPTADANFGKIYCKSDNKLYFQDGAGTEHEIAFV